MRTYVITTVLALVFTAFAVRVNPQFQHVDKFIRTSCKILIYILPNGKNIITEMETSVLNTNNNKLQGFTNFLTRLER